MPRSGQIHIGTSGYQYQHWRSLFYPEGLPTSRWFEFYGRNFDTVEINNTFYQLPSGAVFARWGQAAPSGFCFAVKFSRFGSQMKKLRDTPDPIGRFLEAARSLRDHMGPILVQLHPRWRRNEERLGEFLRVAPRRYRWAFEFREASWLVESVYDLLRRYNAAFCIHDMLGEVDWRSTADWVYVRFHGAAGAKYSGKYTPRALRAAAGRIEQFQRAGLDVYAYFNNDADGNALHNARDLRRLVLNSPKRAESGRRVAG